MSFLFSHAVGKVIFFAPKEALLIFWFDALKAVRTIVVRGSREFLAFVSQKINVSPVIGSLCVPSFGFCYSVDAVNTTNLYGGNATHVQH